MKLRLKKTINTYNPILINDTNVRKKGRTLWGVHVGKLMVRVQAGRMRNTSRRCKKKLEAKAKAHGTLVKPKKGERTRTGITSRVGKSP